LLGEEMVYWSMMWSNGHWQAKSSNVRDAFERRGGLTVGQRRQKVASRP